MQEGEVPREGDRLGPGHIACEVPTGWQAELVVGTWPRGPGIPAGLEKKMSMTGRRGMTIGQ